MKIRHVYGNIYEVVSIVDEAIVWYRGTWKKCQTYMEKHKEKKHEQAR